MSRPDKTMKKIREDYDRIELEIHDCLEKVKSLANMKEILHGYLNPGTQAVPTTSTECAPVVRPKRTYTRKAKVATGEVAVPPPNDPSLAGSGLVGMWQCSQGHTFLDPGKQKVKGAGTVPCCPVPGCGDLDVQRVE